MSNFKRFLSLVVALVMVIGMVPGTVFATEEEAPACEHAYVDGVCTECGASLPDSEADPEPESETPTETPTEPETSAEPEALAETPDPITGTITGDMVWNNGDTVHDVTIAGDVTITVNGTVNVTGTIKMSPDAICNVIFKGENNAKLIRSSDFTGQMFYAEGASDNFQNLTFNNITLDGGAVWTGEADKTLDRGTTNAGVKATGSVLYLVYANADLNGSALQNHDDSTGEKANAVFLRYYSTIDFNDSVVRNNNSISTYYRGGVVTVRQGGTVTTDNAEVYGNSGAAGGFFGISSTGSYGGVAKAYNTKFHNNYSDNGAVFLMQCNSKIGYLKIDGCEFYNNASKTAVLTEWAYSRPFIISNSDFHDNECAVWDCHADPVLDISGKIVVTEDADYTKYLFESPIVLTSTLADGSSIAMSEASIDKLMGSFGYIATGTADYEVSEADLAKFDLPAGKKLILVDVNFDGILDAVPVAEDFVKTEIEVTLKDAKDESVSETKTVYANISYKYSTTATYTGFAFNGWLNSADNKTINTPLIKLEGDATLTAQWKLANPAVTVSVEGATLKAAVTNVGEGITYTYQWYKDDTIITDATEATYTMTDMSSAKYKCTVTASCVGYKNTTGSKTVTASAPAEAQIGETMYGSLAEAVAAANAIEGGATVTLLTDVTLGEMLTISGNVTIEGAYTITRDAAYLGTLFEVAADATLTLDGGLIIDGGNKWTYTKTPLDMDMENGAGTYVGNHITPAEGGVNATAHMIVNKGTLNVNKTTIQNSYSTNGVSAIDCGASSVTTLNGALIQNIAANRSGAVVYVGGADAVLTIKGETSITGNFGIGNGGIIQNYGQGTTVNMEGGSIDNNHVGKSGTLYASYSGNANKTNTFNMSGGIITENVMEGYGPIYIHTNTVWNMTGGEISNNTSFLPSYVRSNGNAATISGGKIVGNVITGTGYSNGYYVTRPDIYLGTNSKISGGTFTQDVTEYLAPDYGMAYDAESGIYSVTDDLYEYNRVAYKTLADVVEAIKSTTKPGGLTSMDTPVVTVLASHKVAETAVVDVDLILNLNRCTIYGNNGVNPIIRVLADVTVTGNGMIDSANYGDGYCFIVGNGEGVSGNLTIENGTFKGTTSAISVTQGKLTILDGDFRVKPYNDSYDFLLNCIDANYKNGTAVIEVKGGVFTNFNPADNAAENPKANFVAEGYISEELTEGKWTVRQLNYVAQVGETKYETLTAAIAAAVDGDEIVLLSDASVSSATIDEDIKINLNGKTMTLAPAAYGGFAITLNGELNIVGEGDVVVAPQTPPGRPLGFGISIKESGKLIIDGGDYSVAAGAIGNIGSVVGELVINGGSFTGATNTSLFNTGDNAKITITNGKFSHVPFEERDSDTREIAISGGKYGDEVPADFCADGYVPTEYEDGTYGVRVANYVAQIGETKYESLTEALNACTNGETVILLTDVVYGDEDVVNAIGGPTGYGDYPNPSIVYIGGTKGATPAENQPSKVNAVLDLNGHTITNNADAYLFLIMDNAKLTFKDSVGTGAVVGNSEAPVLWVTGTDTVVTIESGKYSIGEYGSLMWATHSGDLVIKGGEFGTTAEDASSLIMRNEHDRQNSQYFISGKSTVTVTGGFFKGFNPEKMLDDSKTPASEFDAVAQNHKAIAKNDGYEVVDYIKWIKEQLLAGNDVTLEKDIVVDGSMIESIPASTNGNGKYPNYAIFTVIGDKVTFDLNGHKITYNGHKDFQWNGKTHNSCTVAHGLFYANAGADLTIEDSKGTAEVTVYGLASGGYVASNDTKLTITGGKWVNKGCAECGGTNIFMYPLQGGELYITGGYFEQDLDSEGESYLLVVHGGEYANSVIDYSKTKLEITGGTFVGMNPAEAKYFQQTADNKLVMGETTDTCADGYAAVENGDGSYTVKPQIVVTFDDITYVIGNEEPEFTYETNFAEIAEAGEKLVVAEPEVDLTKVGEYKITAEAHVEGGEYVVKVVPGTLNVLDAVAAIGETKYGSLQAAIDAAEPTGDTITLLKDINLAETELQVLDGSYDTYFLVEGKTVTIDLAGKTISGAYTGTKVMLVGAFATDNGGHLTLTGNGTVDVTATNTVYSLIANYEEGCSITIENGTYKLDKASDSLIYTGGDENVTIKDGTFYLGNVGTGSNGSPWIFNAKGQNTANVIVTGGTFNADVFHQYYIFEVKDTTEVAEKLGVPVKAAKDNDDGTWTIVDAVAYVDEQHKSGKWYTQNTGYATLEEAFAAAGKHVNGDKGNTVTLVQDAEVTSNVVMKEGTTLVCGDYSVVLAAEGATLTAAAGLNVVTNVTGYKVAYEGGVYKLVVKEYVAQIGENKYYSLQKAIDDAAVTGDTITLLKDINLAETELQVLDGSYDTYFLVEGKTVTIDLAGKTISGEYTGSMLVGVFSTDKNGHLTLTGNGTIDVTATGKVYALLVAFNDGSTLTIENGTYKLDKASDSLIYYGGKTDAAATVKGGTFTLGNVGEGENGKPWIVNVLGAGDHHVYITGGTFNADVNRQHWSNEAVVAKECYMVKNSDGTWTVKDGAVAYVHTGMLTGPYYAPKDVGYATLAEAVSEAVAKHDPNVTLLEDNAENVEVGGELVLNLNNNSYTGTITLTAAEATVEAVEGLNVVTNVTGYKVAYEGGVYKLVAKEYVAQIGENKYYSLQEAIDAAAPTGDTITLLTDINLAETELQVLDGSYDTYFLVEGKNVTIDLAGKTISGEYTGSMLVGVFSTDKNGHLTLTGNGTIDVTATGKVYALLVAFNDGSTLTIENGTYKLDKASDSLIFYGGKTDAEVTVKGGTFTLGNVGEGENGKPWIVNVLGAGDHHVYITGGTFNADVNRQHWSNEAVVAKECYTVDNGDGTWTVKDGAVAYVHTGMTTGPYFAPKDVGYATLAEAVEAAIDYNDNPVTLLKDNAEDVAVNGSIKLNVNGKNFTGTITLTAAEATVEAVEGLNVASGMEGYAVSYKDGKYSLVAGAVAAINEALYAKLDDALIDAVSGDTVVLLTDVDVTQERRDGVVIIPTGVTLDIQAYTLTAKYVVGVNGSFLTGQTLLKDGTAGKLDVDENHLVLSETPAKLDGMPVVPLWDADEDNYVLVKLNVFADPENYTNHGLDFETDADGKTTMTFHFRHKATTTVNKKYLNNGLTDNGAAIIVRLEWEIPGVNGGYAYQDFVFNDSFVSQVAGANNLDYKLTINGFEALGITEENISVKAMIITESGLAYADTVFTSNNG